MSGYEVRQNREGGCIAVSAPAADSSRCSQCNHSAPAIARRAETLWKTSIHLAWPHGPAVAPSVRVRQRVRQQSGFSLVETLVAMAIMLVTIGTFIQLFGVAAAANQRAARRSLASLAAMQKMEELRSEAGSALEPSPASVLENDVDGYCDRLPGGVTGVAFTRRWSIEPLLSDPAHLLVLQVVVIAPGGGVEARIVTLRRIGRA